MSQSELSTLIAKRLAQVVFDHEDDNDAEYSSRVNASNVGAQRERFRTRSIDFLWPEMIEALDRSIEVMQFAYMNAPKQPPEIAQALAVLTKLKEACEGEVE